MTLVKAQDCGLLYLSIRNSRGERIGRHDAPDPTELGAREILVERPEPSEAEVVVAYPSGVCYFLGRSLCGERVSGWARLRSGFPDAPEILSPGDEEILPEGDVTIEWSSVAGAREYIVELESSGGLSLETTVPASSYSLNLPAVLFPPGDFELGVAVRGVSADVFVAESVFFDRVTPLNGSRPRRRVRDAASTISPATTQSCSAGRNVLGISEGGLDDGDFGSGSGDESLPSGEATQAFALAPTVAGYRDSRWVKGRGPRSCGPAGRTAPALDAHWASEEFAGALVGASVGPWLVRRYRPDDGEESADRPGRALGPNVGPSGRGVGLALRATF